MRKTAHGLYVPGGEDPDRILFPSMDFVTKDEPIVRFRSLQDAEFRKELTFRRRFMRDERGAASIPFQYSWALDLSTQQPQFFGAAANIPVGVTPTTLGSTVARVFPFSIVQSVWVFKVYIQTPNAVASSMQLGIFGPTGGDRFWNSGTLSTTANYTVITPATGFVIPGGGFCFLGITNANLTSATTAYYFSPAFSASGVVRFGTVAATAGAMPSTVTPSGITATVGGFPVYTWIAVG